MNTLYNNVPLFRSFIQFVDGMLTSPKQAPFIIRLMDYKKTSSEREVVLEFTGLISSDDYDNSIEISYYPVVNGDIGVDGLYKTEGASFVLVAHIQFKHGISKAELQSKKREIMAQMNKLVLAEQNLYIEQQANMPQPEENVRISKVKPIKVNEIIDGLRFEIPCQNVRFIDPTLEFDPAKPSVTPEYAPIDRTGTSKSTDVPVDYNK